MTTCSFRRLTCTSPKCPPAENPLELPPKARGVAEEGTAGLIARGTAGAEEIHAFLTLSRGQPGPSHP